MSLTVGLIGTGMIGSALARLATHAGLDVVLSNSRGPHTLAALVTELGPRARAALPAEAAQAGDIVVATIPFLAYPRLPADALAGKVVIDTMNYYPERDTAIPELETATATSSELVQRHLNDSQVVKACNTIEFQRLVMLARPAGAPDRSGLPIFGDAPAAVGSVTRLLDALGYDAVYSGTLADSWRSAPGTPVYVRPYLPPQPDGMSRAELQRWFVTNPGRPVPAARIRELVDTATRIDPAAARMTLDH